MTSRPSCVLFALLAGPLAALAQANPAADHHQHVFSPAWVELVSTPASPIAPIDSAHVLAVMDVAGVKNAVLLSTGYTYGSPFRKVDDEYAKVRAENDWTATQAARAPERLLAFCGFNPLRDYALPELERCAADPRLRHGIKLHFGNSDVRLEDPTHVGKLQDVFRAANAKRMAIVVHLRANITNKRPYGKAQAHAFLDVAAVAPDVVVQVAHMAGSGPGYDDPPAQEVMAMLAQAVQRRDPRAKALWFDVATVVNQEIAPETATVLARFIGQVGAERVLYGSDAMTPRNPKPREAWAAFRKLPLREDELARIASNVAPYFSNLQRSPR